MSPGDWRLINVTGLIVIVQIVAFKRFFWDAPLKHGSGFFFGVEAPPGFYEGAGGRWLKGYRVLILAVNLVLALVLVALLISGRWHLLPAWAGSVAASHVAALLGFRAYARAKLGRNSAVQTRAAVSLDTRRIGDYLWWPGEALMAGVIVLCWALLLAHGDGQVRWSTPVLLTYVVLGLFLLDIGFVRTSFPPLPADRPEEHRLWMEAYRHWWVRVWNVCRWFLATVFLAYALKHGWHAVVASAWSRSLLFAGALAVWLILVISVFLSERRLTTMGRGLRPAGSWSTPFHQAGLMPRNWMVWFGVWFGGLVVLIAVSVR